MLLWRGFVWPCPRQVLEGDVDQPIEFRSEPVRTRRTPPEAVRNRLRLALSLPDLSLLEPWLERVPLPVAMRLIEPNTPIEHVYFLEQGIASVVATTPQGAALRQGSSGGRV
jgi:hypothetical protein